MIKKIMILNGSPRRNGNTSKLIESFTKGAKDSGNTVTEFFLDEMNIHGCKGCFGDGKVLEKCFVVVSWLWEISQKSQNYRKLINLENQFNKTLVGLSLSPPCHTRHPRSS